MKENEAFSYQFENAERIGYLIANFVKGTLTPGERKELDDWILQSEKNELLFDELTSDENIAKTMQWYEGLDVQNARQRVKKRIPFKKERRIISLSFITVAASITLILGIATFVLWQKNGQRTGDTKTIAVSKEVLPGSSKAILTLADGSKFVLDSTAPKTIADGSIKIAAGGISYDTVAAIPPKENLLTVPRGGQFMLTLADGTRVWLNAESSLKYTTSFVGSERKVVLTGEAYFEVAKNKRKPFIVESSAGRIKVLGTHFNINSYGDENVFSTTLLEGSVEVTKGETTQILKPGQQARVTENKLEVVPVDTKIVLAWKEGNFIFSNAPVSTIVHQLARWYNLDVEFRDPVEKHLNATISRDVPLSKVLHYLEETGEVHFKVEERKLIVMK